MRRNLAALSVVVGLAVAAPAFAKGPQPKLSATALVTQTGGGAACPVTVSFKWSTGKTLIHTIDVAPVDPSVGAVDPLTRTVTIDPADNRGTGGTSFTLTAGALATFSVTFFDGSSVQVGASAVTQSVACNA
jgi:hypothetical protein